MIRLQGMTLSPENWKENSRNPYPTMLIQSNVGNNRSLKTRIYRETLVDTPRAIIIRRSPNIFPSSIDSKAVVISIDRS